MPGWRKIETIWRVALVGTAILGLGRVASAEPESVRIDYVACSACSEGALTTRDIAGTCGADGVCEVAAPSCRVPRLPGRSARGLVRP
jgi:hypothetical protein